MTGKEFDTWYNDFQEEFYLLRIDIYDYISEIDELSCKAFDFAEDNGYDVDSTLYDEVKKEMEAVLEEAKDDDYKSFGNDSEADEWFERNYRM